MSRLFGRLSTALASVPVLLGLSCPRLGASFSDSAEVADSDFQFVLGAAHDNERGDGRRDERVDYVWYDDASEEAHVPLYGDSFFVVDDDADGAGDEGETPSAREPPVDAMVLGVTDPLAPTYEQPEPKITEPSSADLVAAGVLDDVPDLEDDRVARDDSSIDGLRAGSLGGDDSESAVSEPASAGQENADDHEDEQFVLVALRKETWVYAEPRWSSRRIGYLRLGSSVRRSERPLGRKECAGGWYGIEPKGFVCVGRSASIAAHHPMVEAAGRAPDRRLGLPYPYVMSEYPPPPRYVRLPSVDEQRSVEPDFDKHLQKRRNMHALSPHIEDVPGSLLYNRSLPSPTAAERPRDALHLGRPVPRSGWGLLSVFSWTDRLFGVTTDLDLIPLDRTRPVVASTMSGIHIVEDQGLPVVFVHAHGARLYRIDSETYRVTDVGPIRYREGFSLSGKRTRVGGFNYLHTTDGYYLREGPRMVFVNELKERPSWATRGRKWIDVSVVHQTLVAYEGMRPVFATMVSTGADGLGDPAETRSTVLGAFLIHTKHVTVAMRGDTVGDVYDLQDVPYVQFFHDGYALHGAYWHDGFGTPRSHGCINLSPQDAAWLFGWTDPVVPEGWHGSLQLRGGTLLWVRP